MTSLELEGDNLGQKHQHYNKLLKEAIENQGLSETLFKGDGDIEHMLKIDIASRNRNVDYLLEAFKSEDMLLVSRAIKKSTWLITDEQYAHIMNVDYLHTQLFPHMMTKAINKLMLSIRLHLKDEKRVDSFYNYEKENNVKNAMKWLQHCSLSVIEHAVEFHINDIPYHLIIRLCRRSLSVLELYIKNCKYLSYVTLNSTIFLMKTYIEKYLDVVETVPLFYAPRFRSKYTHILMKKCRDRVLNNFEKYLYIIHIPTVARHLNENDVMDFLEKMCAKHSKDSKDSKLHSFFSYDNIKYFLRRMPTEGRFKCLKQIFIHEHTVESHKFDSHCNSRMYTVLENIKKSDFKTVETHCWYEFASFDEALHDLKKLIHAETSASKRIAIIEVLLKSAGKSSQRKLTVLQYFHDNHINEPFHLKIQFIKYYLEGTDVTKVDDKSWNILDRLFHSMDVYIESKHNVEICVETIILYNAIHGKSNPKIIEDKFELNTLKKYITKLNNEERENAFDYLYKHLLIKIHGENNMEKVVTLLEGILNLFKDWDKNILDYPLILDKINELIKIKTEKELNIDLVSLYTINKSWRKHMFEQSITLNPTDEVCLNILKHDAKLFSRYKDEVVEIICSDEAKSTMRLLSKLRVYWPHSLTIDLKNIFIKSLETPSIQKPIIKGLITILPQEETLNFVKKYAPQENKIKWSEDDGIIINLRKYIAMNMYLTTPLISINVILYYAKGDYLQHTIPSFSSILHNLSRNQSGREIPKLLDTPVSLQKCGIRAAVLKLKASELKPLFENLWKNSKHPSLRAVLFKHTFEGMCAENNALTVQERWELLSMYIDNMTSNESSVIYEILGKVEKVPSPVKGKFYMKTYIFLKNLPEGLFIKWKHIQTRLLNYAAELIHFLDSNFITDVLLKPMCDNCKTKKFEPRVLNALSSFVLSAQDAETQNERYKKVLCPLINSYLSAWNDEHGDINYVHLNFQKLLKRLNADSQLSCLDKKNHNLVNIFSDILNKLENTSSITDNYYVIFTSWKLTVAFVKVVDELRSTLPYVEIGENDNICKLKESNLKTKIDKAWNEMFLQMVPSLAKIFGEHLKEDMERYFPTIFILFGKAVQDNFKTHTNIEQFLKLLKYVLQNNLSIQTYLLVISICDKPEPCRPYEPEVQEIFEEILKLLKSHPSPQIKMHYIAKFEHVE